MPAPRGGRSGSGATRRSRLRSGPDRPGAAAPPAARRTTVGSSFAQRSVVNWISALFSSAASASIAQPEPIR